MPKSMHDKASEFQYEIKKHQDGNKSGNRKSVETAERRPDSSGYYAGKESANTFT